MTGLRGRVSIVGGALMIMAGLAIPAATATPAAAVPAPASGVDVSGLTTFTSSTPWPGLAQSGNTFVGVKATEGDYYKDPDYIPDVKGAVAAGLYVMPYVFANPYPGNGTAAQQADYAWTNEISKAAPAYLSSKLMLPLVLDIEADPYAGSEKNGNQCYGLTQSAMVTWIQQFLAEAKAKTKKTPIIYTAPNWWSACTGNSTAFSGYPLWLADYGVSDPAVPSGWNNLTFWQYTSGGTAVGIKGGTDLDYLGPVLQASHAGQADRPGAAPHAELAERPGRDLQAGHAAGRAEGECRRADHRHADGHPWLLHGDGHAVGGRRPGHDDVHLGRARDADGELAGQPDHRPQDRRCRSGSRCPTRTPALRCRSARPGCPPGCR